MIRRSGYDGGIDSQTRMPWMSNFRPFDRETGFLLPPSLDDWLPERHLARFVVEVVGSLDLSAMARSYRGTGSASYHPELLLGVLVYGYTTGVFSSRKLERATYDSVAFRFIFGDAFSKRSKGCSCGCWNWRARWACSRWVRWDWTARKSTPMPADTARCLMSTPARSRCN